MMQSRLSLSFSDTMFLSLWKEVFSASLTSGMASWLLQDLASPMLCLLVLDISFIVPFSLIPPLLLHFLHLCCSPPCSSLVLYCQP